MISIAMTNYNGEQFVAAAIDSIAMQNYRKWELVIVDDASTDHSIKAIKARMRLWKIGKKMKIIKSPENMGYGGALKTAIENCSHELIAIVDSDDALNGRDALGLSVSAHLKHPDVALTYSNYYICDQTLRKKRLFKTTQIPEGKTYFDYRVRVSHLKVLKRSFYDKTEGVDDYLRKAVDKDLVLKLEEVGKLLHLDAALYNYRKHPKALSSRYNIKGTLGKRAMAYRKRIFENAKLRRGLT